MIHNNNSPQKQFEKYQEAAHVIGAPDYAHQIIHYAGVQAFESILKTNEIWFGCLKDMNDTSECYHFMEAVIEDISKLIPSVTAAALHEIIEVLKQKFREGTYISSWCEYDEAEPNGRLSMWREYADDAKGVGLVIDSSEFQPSKLTADKLGFHIFSSKVLYIPEDSAVSHAHELLKKFHSLGHMKIPMHNPEVIALLLAAQAISIKHDAFYEEEEIRFMLVKGLMEALGHKVLIGEMTSHDGREFYALPLKNYPEFGFDLGISKILKKVVVGPSSDKAERAQEIRNILDKSGLDHVPIHVSEIPLK